MSLPYSIDKKWIITKIDDSSVVATDVVLVSNEFTLKIERKVCYEYCSATLSFSDKNRFNTYKEYKISFPFKELQKKDVIGIKDPSPFDLIVKAQQVFIDEGILFGEPMTETIIRGDEE